MIVAQDVANIVDAMMPQGSVEPLSARIATAPVGSRAKPDVLMAKNRHMAFVADRFDQALQHYDQALTLGAPSGPIQHSIGLTHLHRGDLQAARTALHDAQEAGDAEAEKVLETLSP